MGVHTNKLEKHMKQDNNSLNTDYLLNFAQAHVDGEQGLATFALAIYV